MPLAIQLGREGNAIVVRIQKLCELFIFVGVSNARFTRGRSIKVLKFDAQPGTFSRRDTSHVKQHLYHEGMH